MMICLRIAHELLETMHWGEVLKVLFKHLNAWEASFPHLSS